MVAYVLKRGRCVEHLPGVLTPTSIRSHIGSSLSLSKPLKPRAAGRRTSMEGPPRLISEANGSKGDGHKGDSSTGDGSKGDGPKGDGSKGDDAMGYTELAWDGDGVDIVIRVTS